MGCEAAVSVESILSGQRMSLDDCFSFGCGPERDCFGKCCRDVTIVLTPYDVLRLKRATGLESSEFLEKHTLCPRVPDQKFPVVILKMNEEDKNCPFLGAAHDTATACLDEVGQASACHGQAGGLSHQGCGVYNDRPWACRMYPLGAAQPKEQTPVDRPFHFVLKEDLCHGHGESQPIMVRDWIANQGAEAYEMMSGGFKELTLHDFWDSDKSLTEQQAAMFYMACYDVDRFRRFVFESRFLQLFEVDEARVEALRTDDQELLEFAMQWLRFALFAERSMRPRKGVQPRRNVA